ncbi:MAG TPA: hypothetical protein VGH56_04475, partial [Solirubrobacteraceae bacterium]
MAAHPDPERFAAEFSGTERTVAEYLLDEVLDNLPDEVRQFLLRTSVLERVNGPLADLLSGGSGGEQVLLELEQANAFVVALDARRSWFRYHHLFADLLQLGLRRTGLDEVRRLHSAAATWFAEHEYPVQAVGHAQAAGDWGLAVRLLSDHWFALWLSGEEVTAHALLAGFPSDLGVDDPELAALVAADELNPGSLAHADQQLALATRRSALVPADRREHVDALLAVVRLRLARQRTDLPAAVEEAQRLLAPLEPVATPRLGLGAELRTVALLNLGVAELWKAEGARRLEQALALARQTQRPYLELGCLANLALALVRRSFTAGFRASTQAVDLAQNHGWTEEPIVGVAYIAGGAVLVWQLHLDEAARWLGRAQRAFRAELEPAQGLLLHRYRGMLELARGRDEEALAALRAAVRLEEFLAAPHPHSHGSPHSFAAHSQALMLQGMLRMGETERVRQALMEMDDGLRESPEMRKATAALLLAQNDPEAAAAVLEPVIDGSVPTA